MTTFGQAFAHAGPGVLAVLALSAGFHAWTLEIPSQDVGPRNETVDLNRYQRVRYVAAQSGSDESGDGSAAKPWASIRFALVRIADAGANNAYAILVGEGTYPGVGLRMKPHVDLYGGFGSAWRRAIFDHPSILDASHAGRLVIGAPDSRLDGFVLTGGKFTGPGGGILCDNASPVIANNVITGNQTLEPPEFRHDLLHQIGNDGGAIACVNTAKPAIVHNIIARNATGVGNGGGIACRNQSSPVIDANVIYDNSTGLTDRGPSRSSNGGGISCSTSSSPRISHNVIAGNRVAGNSDAGGIYIEYDSSPVIERNWIVGNRAEDDGGGIYIMKLSLPVIRGNIIVGNRATSGGGGIRLSKEGRAEIIENLIAANTASGGAVTCVDSWLLLRKNLITGNIGKDVGGLVYSNRYRYLKAPIAIGDIIYGNSGREVSSKSAAEQLVVSDSIIEGGYAGERNRDVSPGFVDDSFAGKYLSLSYDTKRFLTRVATRGAGKWAGRVVHMNGRWSVVQDAGDDGLLVWGNLMDQGAGGTGEYRILGTYKATVNLNADSAFGR